MNFEKEGRTPMQQILGTNQAVHDMANFFDKKGNDYALLSSYLIHTYVSVETFTPAELIAYKKAHADMGSILLQCWQEREAEKLKKNSR